MSASSFGPARAMHDLWRRDLFQHSLFGVVGVKWVKEKVLLVFWTLVEVRASFTDCDMERETETIYGEMGVWGRL